MITAERFARGRPSYWTHVTPRLEQFVRAINRGLGRFAPPVTSSVSRDRRALVAEVAFELVKEHIRLQRVVTADEFRDITQRVVGLIAQHAPEHRAPVLPPSVQERREAVVLARNLHTFFRRFYGATVTAHPEIPGCGIIDSCKVDFQVTRRLRPQRPSGGEASEETLLYEVKSVERPFRSIDFRQLVVYATLMFGRGEPPDVVGLINPRLGTYFSCSLEELCLDIAGLQADELLQEILYDISVAEISP